MIRYVFLTEDRLHQIVLYYTKGILEIKEGYK